MDEPAALAVDHCSSLAPPIAEKEQVGLHVHIHMHAFDTHVLLLPRSGDTAIALWDEPSRKNLLEAALPKKYHFEFYDPNAFLTLRNPAPSDDGYNHHYWLAPPQKTA